MKLIGITLSSILLSSSLLAADNDCAKEFAGKFSSSEGENWVKFNEKSVVSWHGPQGAVAVDDVVYVRSNLIKGFEGKDLCAGYTEGNTFVLVDSKSVYSFDDQTTYKRVLKVEVLSRFSSLPELFKKPLESRYHRGIGQMTLLPTKDSATTYEYTLRPDYNKCDWNNLGETINCTEMGTMDIQVKITPLVQEGDWAFYAVIGSQASQGQLENTLFKIIYNVATKEIFLMNSDVSDVIDPGYNLASAAYQGRSKWKVELKPVK